jgi:hypothetical protein
LREDVRNWIRQEGGEDPVDFLMAAIRTYAAHAAPEIEKKLKEMRS